MMSALKAGNSLSVPKALWRMSSKAAMPAASANRTEGKSIIQLWGNRTRPPVDRDQQARAVVPGDEMGDVLDTPGRREGVEAEYRRGASISTPGSSCVVVEAGIGSGADMRMEDLSSSTPSPPSSPPSQPSSPGLIARPDANAIIGAKTSTDPTTAAATPAFPATPTLTATATTNTSAIASSSMNAVAVLAGAGAVPTCGPTPNGSAEPVDSTAAGSAPTSLISGHREALVCKKPEAPSAVHTLLKGCVGEQQSAACSVPQNASESVGAATVAVDQRQLNDAATSKPKLASLVQGAREGRMQRDVLGIFGSGGQGGGSASSIASSVDAANSGVTDWGFPEGRKVDAATRWRQVRTLAACCGAP